VPKLDQPGNFKFLGDSSKNEFSARLLFYRGMFNDSDGIPYPLGSSDVYEYNGQKITDANHSLHWDGQYGLYENFHKDYVYWLMNIAKFVKFKKHLTPLDLFNLDFSKKYHAFNFNMLIKEVRVTLTPTAIRTAEIDAYTCP
jgi:hypothetical protein